LLEKIIKIFFNYLSRKGIFKYIRLLVYKLDLSKFNKFKPVYFNRKNILGYIWFLRSTLYSKKFNKFKLVYFNRKKIFKYIRLLRYKLDLQESNRFQIIFFNRENILKYIRLIKYKFGIEGSTRFQPIYQFEYRNIQYTALLDNVFVKEYIFRFNYSYAIVCHDKNDDNYYILRGRFFSDIRKNNFWTINISDIKNDNNDEISTIRFYQEHGKDLLLIKQKVFIYIVSIHICDIILQDYLNIKKNNNCFYKKISMIKVV